MKTVSMSILLLSSFFAVGASAARADDRGHITPTFSTEDSDPSSQSTASSNWDHTHILGSFGGGAVASSNNVQGSSAGVAAQVKLRGNGRYGQALFDERANATFNVITSGPAGAASTISVRNETMVGGAVQDIRNTCSFYAAGSGYVRGELATGNASAANSFRTMFGPESGLACDVGGVLVEVSPTVGFAMATSASTGLSTSSGPMSGGVSVVGGGVARLNVNDRVSLSARAAKTISNSVMSGGATGNMTMVGADVDVRVTDRWSVGVTADGIQYGQDSTPPSQGGGITRNDGQVTSVITATF